MAWLLFDTEFSWGRNTNFNKIIFTFGSVENLYDEGILPPINIQAKQTSYFVLEWNMIMEETGILYFLKSGTAVKTL